MEGKETSLEIVKNRTFVFVWLCLLVLTAITVAVSKLHFTNYAALFSIAIATAKAGLVVTYFMDLRQEPLILKLMLLAALTALALIVLLTFADVWYRYR